jgi:hypothetical protein
MRITVRDIRIVDKAPQCARAFGVLALGAAVAAFLREF